MQRLPFVSGFRQKTPAVCRSWFPKIGGVCAFAAPALKFHEYAPNLDEMCSMMPEHWQSELERKLEQQLEVNVRTQPGISSQILDSSLISIKKVAFCSYFCSNFRSNFRSHCRSHFRSIFVLIFVLTLF